MRLARAMSRKHNRPFWTERVLKNLVLASLIFSVPGVVAADFPPGHYGPDGLSLGGEGVDGRQFLGYIPDFKEGLVIVRSRIPRYLFAEPAHCVPTIVDGMTKVERNGSADSFACFPSCPQQKFFWFTISARGWLLAKLKEVGRLDAFMAPYLLGPPCQFCTNLQWVRYAESSAKGRTELD